MAHNIEETWLISLVSDRPVIWDKSIAEYRDKARTFEAWKEICAALNEDFPSMTNGEKMIYGKFVTKKWNTLRDGWMKCHKKLLSKTKEECRKIRKYMFYDEMKFLTKIVPLCSLSNDTKYTVYNSYEGRNTSDEEESEIVPTSKKMKREESTEGNNFVTYYIDEDDESTPSTSKTITETERTPRKEVILNEIDTKLMKLINSIQEKKKCSPAMSFFKGIEPIVAKFNDTDLVEFQYEVMSIIRSIQQKKNST